VPRPADTLCPSEPDVPISTAMSAMGISYRDLRAASEEIVLFGSRAAGIARTRSDWDLLCVGNGLSRMTPALDLIWLSPNELRSSRWLGSELAVHIAHYGVWLKGKPAWKNDVAVSDQAIDKKAAFILARVEELKRHWFHFSRPYRVDYITRVRRDLQRLDLLLRRLPVPPTRMLDRIWCKTDDRLTELLRIMGRSDAFPAPVRSQVLTAYLTTVDTTRRSVRMSGDSC
jgi:hypothetical protein